MRHIENAIRPRKQDSIKFIKNHSIFHKSYVLL